MINCKKSTEFVLQKEEGSLSANQRFQLFSHLAICKLCWLFAKQSSIINKAFRKNTTIENMHLTNKEKDELFKNVKNKSLNNLTK